MIGPSAIRNLRVGSSSTRTASPSATGIGARPKCRASPSGCTFSLQVPSIAWWPLVLAASAQKSVAPKGLYLLLVQSSI